MRSLYILFISSGFSKKLHDKILEGKIDALIFCKTPSLMTIKKRFQDKSKGYFKIVPFDLPYTMDTFNYVLTSKSFWDQIDPKYHRTVIVHNPHNINLEIKVKNHKKFRFYPFSNQRIDFTKFPILDPLQTNMGFIVCIERKFAINTITRFAKKNIVSLRKELKMDNTEDLERSFSTPFYSYFYHYYLTLGYDN